MASPAHADPVVGRVRATLLTIIVVAALLAVAEGWLAYSTQSLGLAYLAVATGLFVLALVPPVWLNSRGEHGRAVFHACLAIVGIQIAYLMGYPRAYPAITIASMVVVAMALPFVRGRALFGVVAASWSIGIVAILFGVLGRELVPVPTAADPVVLLGSGIAAVTVAMVLLWKFAQHMTGALAEATQARDELAAAHAKLQELDALKSRFINSAAHELNTPLTPVLLQLDLLERRLGDGQETLRRSVHVVERNMRRIAGLVRDMLDVARLQAGRTPILSEDVDLEAAVREVVEDYAAIAEEARVQLSCACPSPARASLDRRHVSQILSNLVSNAVRLTPPGGRVEVSVQAEGDDWAIRVLDSGIGMTAQQLGGLFQPFGRVHEEGEAGAGTGLGLYISRSLAQAMGGRLEADSAGRGKGACFTLRLPPIPRRSEVASTSLLASTRGPPFAAFK